MSETTVSRLPRKALGVVVEKSSVVPDVSKMSCFSCSSRSSVSKLRLLAAAELVAVLLPQLDKDRSDGRRQLGGRALRFLHWEREGPGGRQQGSWSPTLTDGCGKQHPLNVPEGRCNQNMGHKAAHPLLPGSHADDVARQPKPLSSGFAQMRGLCNPNMGRKAAHASPLRLSVGESLTTSEAGRAVWVASPSRSVVG